MNKNFMNEVIQEYDNANRQFVELKNEYYEKGLPVNYIYYYNMLMKCYNEIGSGEFLVEKNIEECKKNFYKSAYMMKTIIENLEEMYDEEWGYDFWNEIDQLYFAILSDNYSFTIELTKLIGNIDIKQESIKSNDEKFVYYVMYFYKNYIQNNIDTAKECVKGIRSTTEKDIPKFCLLLGDIFESLLCKDSEQLSNILNLFCEGSKKNKIYKGTFKQVLCIEGLAIAKLAIINGIDVNLDKSVVGRELLEKTNIDYPKIEII